MAKFIAALVCLACLIHSQAANAQSLPGQPSNSYVSGANWYCKSGYRKQGNRCVNIFDKIGGQPPNSYVSGANWYCKSGYRKQGNRCVSIFADKVDQTPTKPTDKSRAVAPVPRYAPEPSAQTRRRSPDLSHLSDDEQRMIRYACSAYQSSGPASYYRCLRERVASLKKSSGPPSLSHLSDDEQRMIRYACSAYQSSGPASYYRCLRDQVASLGPDRTPPHTIPPRHPRAPEEPITLPKGTKTDPEVYQVQRLLKSLGYGPGTVDGRIGPRTRRAIKAFQRDRSLQSDGKVTRSLLSALQMAIRNNKRNREAPRPRTIEPKIAAIPQFNWPIWKSVKAELPSAQSKSRLSPAVVYEAVKDNIWIIVAGRRTMDFKKSRKLSQGSAVAVLPEHLLTNCHVVKERPLIVIVQGKAVKEASLASADPLSDRCILKVRKPTLSPVKGVRPFSDLKVGERVYSVGAPSGLELTLGEGIISGLRSSEKGRFIQTTAPISPGSSGGGLFDSSGNLIGITTFLLKEAQSLNFAIAAEDFWR